MIGWFRVPLDAAKSLTGDHKATRTEAMIDLLGRWHIGGNPGVRELMRAWDWSGDRVTKLVAEMRAWAAENGATAPDEKAPNKIGQRPDSDRTVIGHPEAVATSAIQVSPDSDRTAIGQPPDASCARVPSSERERQEERSPEGARPPACTPAHPCTPTCARLRRCVAYLPARTEHPCPTAPSSPSSAPLTAPPAPPPAAPSSAPASSARSGDTSLPSRTTSAAQPSTRSPERVQATTTTMMAGSGTAPTSSTTSNTASTVRSSTPTPPTDGYGAALVRVGDVDLPPDLVALTGGNLRLVGKLTQAGIDSTRGLLLIPLAQWSDPDTGKCFVPGCGALVGTLRALLADRWGVDLGALAPRPAGRVGGFAYRSSPDDGAYDGEEQLRLIMEADAREDARRRAGA